MNVRALLLVAISLAFTLATGGACSLDDRAFSGAWTGDGGGGSRDPACALGAQCGCPGMAACPECEDASSCSPSGKACVVAACVDNKCTLKNLDDGTRVVREETHGDCRKVVCSGGVPTSVVDLLDPPDPASDGENCTRVLCAPDGGVEHENEPDGSPCAGGSCSAGQCLHVDGMTCGAHQECTSGICADTVCCQDVCGPCTSCAMPGNEGTCTPKPVDSDDFYCPIDMACDGAGNCKVASGKLCLNNDMCATGCCATPTLGSPPICAPKSNCLP